MAPRWTDDEIAVIVYFRSRGFSIPECTELLEKRGKSRTVTAVAQKLVELSQAHSLSNEDREWSIENCDRYIGTLRVYDKSELLSLSEDERLLLEVPNNALYYSRLNVS